MSVSRQFIKDALEKHPFVINSLIYGSLCVSAEFSQQTLTKKIMHIPPTQYDTAIMGRYVIYGTMMAGPFLTLWYRFLDKKFIGTSTKVVINKLLLDQFFFTPQILVLFFVAMSAMEGKEDIFEECRHKFEPTFKTSCLFWLPAQGINFLFVPPVFRVTYIGICASAWVNYLCWIKRQDD